MSKEAMHKISLELEGVCKALDGLFQQLGDGTRIGFALHVFDPEPNGRASYVSNCKREEVAQAMTELLEHWSNGMPNIPAHEFN